MDIAQVNQKKGVSTNPVVHIFGACYGVVNLNLFHPKLLCDPPPPLPPSGYPAGGWVGLRVGGWVSQNTGRANLTHSRPPISLSKSLAGNPISLARSVEIPYFGVLWRGPGGCTGLHTINPPDGVHRVRSVSQLMWVSLGRVQGGAVHGDYLGGHDSCQGVGTHEVAIWGAWAVPVRHLPVTRLSHNLGDEASLKLCCW